MATKKDFSTMNTGRLYNNIAQATSDRAEQTPASPEEAAQRAAEMRTQGRKGCKATRINLALTPDNHAAVKLLASVTGKSMTEVINDILAAYMDDHAELTDQARAFIDKLNNHKW